MIDPQSTLKATLILRAAIVRTYADPPDPIDRLDRLETVGVLAADPGWALLGWDAREAVVRGAVS